MAHEARPTSTKIVRIRSLIVTTAKGLPDCSALILSDISGHIKAEERFERMFAANPAPAVICRLSDLRFVKVNEGFLQLSGFNREDVLGRSVYEVDVLERAERRDLAIQRLKSGETIPQMEACLRLPKDAERYVIVAVEAPRGPSQSFGVYPALSMRAAYAPPIPEVAHDPERHCREAEAPVQGRFQGPALSRQR